MELLSVIMSMVGRGEIVMLLIPLVILVLTIAALIDVLKHNFSGNDKIVWVIVVILIPIIGAILYFLIGKNQQIKSNG
jgi:hypothetical protein